MTKFKKGFTLIELMIVIAVIAILATMSLFGLSNAQKSARDTQRLQVMNSMRSALQKYYTDNNGYPATVGFATMMGNINQYLGSASDPNCGGTPLALPTAAAAGTSWVPGGNCTNVTYTYAGAATGYTLTLNKEGGGTSSFLSPQ